jgi:cytosine/adenosine deaminase-related metal-dependent hydrolase
MHVHETAAEVKRPGAARLPPAGAGWSSAAWTCRPGLLAVHMTQLETDEIERSPRPAPGVHCPQSNLKLASGFCPAQTWTRPASTWRWAPTAPPATTTSTCWRDADRGPAGQGRQRRRLRPARRRPHCAWRRSTAPARLGSRPRPARWTVGKAADMVAVDLGARRPSRSITRSRNWSTPRVASRSAMSGSPAGSCCATAC